MLSSLSLPASRSRTLPAAVRRVAILLGCGLGCCLPSSRAMAEDDGSVWSATRKWSVDEERRYAEWIENEVDETFFLRHKIPTDCADAVYALRFIFARIRHLPQGVHSMYGTTFGHWRRDYDNLPRHEQWDRDERFLRALRTVTTDFALVRCLVADAHPTHIWPEDGFLRAGTLLTSPDHAALVLSVDRSRFFPIQCVYSTLPPKTRSLIRVNYGDELTSRQEGFGVLNWNWWRVNADTGKYEMVPDEEMLGYSEEQYHFEVGSLAPRLQEVYALDRSDGSKALDEMVVSLRASLELRAEIVESGYSMYVGTDDRTTGTHLHYTYSTPGRDGRLRGKFEEINALAAAGVIDRQEMAERLSTEMIGPKSTPPLSFLEIQQALLSGTASSEPWDRPASRWGVEPYRIEWLRCFGPNVGLCEMDDAGRATVFADDGPPIQRIAADGAVEVASESLMKTWRAGFSASQGLRETFGLAAATPGRPSAAEGPDPLVLSDGSVVAVWTNGWVALYRVDGHRVWRTETKGYLFGGPAVASDGTIYQPTEAGDLLALDPADGSIRWRAALDARIICRPVVAAGSGNIFVAAANLVVAVSPEGHEIWRHALDGALYASPAVGSDGSVYAASVAGDLQALGPDGAFRWRFASRSGIVSSPLPSPDGQSVTVLTQFGDLYRLSSRK